MEKLLEESHIVKRVRPFAFGKRREITSSPKVFFIDNGFFFVIRNTKNPNSIVLM